MPQAQPATLELGQRAIGRPFSKATGALDLFSEMHIASGVFQAGVARHDREHLKCVMRPVGGAVKHALGRQSRGNQLDDLGADQPAFVMTRLGPRIGKNTWTAASEAGAIMSCSTLIASC